MTGAGASSNSAVPLPAKLNSAAAEDVLAAVKAQQGNPICLDASQVMTVGAQCLQILVAAQRFWQTAGKKFEIINLSEAVRDNLSVYGLTADQIGAGEGANNA